MTIAKRRLRTALGAFALGAILSLPITSNAQAPEQPFDHAGLARQVLERHIEPGYRALTTATRELSETLNRVCAQPFKTRPKRVDAAFDKVVKAWGHIEHINFGPITSHNRLERFLFFPDRRGLGSRQVARAIETADAAVTDVSTLATRSVALQGLGALDIVLFASADPAADASPEKRLHRCRYAQAIAANLAEISHSVLQDWTKPDGFRQQWLDPKPGNPAFVKPAETTMVLAKAFNQGLERARDERLGGPMGLIRNKARTLPVLDKSNRSLALVAADIEGLLDFYERGGMRAAIAPADLAGDKEGTVPKARITADELRTAAKIITLFVGRPKPFDDPEIKRRLIGAGFPLKNAREITAELLTRRAGLTLGFNSSDGD